ncbi:hypothetical protein RJ640_011415 [Escallonia rubra]|uniref:SHSP domain-containing protein n=1 Tax=Escallonia rubra TaxID=112253 RepID=A0AA88R3P1_9ASTE|nr:hypothetical protein RJ640_011415 [Escallonia rubra]
MKVHPVATKRNISARDAMDSTQARNVMEGSAPKRLRRLPHVFSKVLELPFPSDADVSIEDSPECVRFVAAIGDDAARGGVRARAVEIHDGVTKVVIRGVGDVADLLLDKLEVDVWRFRLPAATRPELASAVVVDGELVVTVPKDDGGGGGGCSGGREVWGGMSRRVILVQ